MFFIRLVLIAVIFGAGKGAEHGSIIAGLVALFAFGLLEPRLFVELADGISYAADWVRDRV